MSTIGAFFFAPAASAGPRRLQLVTLLRAHCYYHYCDQTKAGKNLCKNADVEICKVAGRRYSAIDTSIYNRGEKKHIRHREIESKYVHLHVFFFLLPLHEYETNDVKTKGYFEWRHCQEEVSDDVPPKKYILHVCVFNVTLSAPLRLCDLCT